MPSGVIFASMGGQPSSSDAATPSCGVNSCCRGGEPSDDSVTDVSLLPLLLLPLLSALLFRSTEERWELARDSERARRDVGSMVVVVVVEV